MRKKIYVVLAIFLFVSFVVVNLKINSQKEPGKTTVEGKIIEGFPQIPVFPYTVVKRSYKKESGGKVGYEASFTSDKPPKEAMLWYRQELERQGWSIYDEAIEGIEGEYFIMAESGGKKVNVFAESEEGETEITVEMPLQ